MLRECRRIYKYKICSMGLSKFILHEPQTTRSSNCWDMLFWTYTDKTINTVDFELFRSEHLTVQTPLPTADGPDQWLVIVSLCCEDTIWSCSLLVKCRSQKMSIYCDLDASLLWSAQPSSAFWCCPFLYICLLWLIGYNISLNCLKLVMLIRQLIMQTVVCNHLWAKMHKAPVHTYLLCPIFVVL